MIGHIHHSFPWLSHRAHRIHTFMHVQGRNLELEPIGFLDLKLIFCKICELAHFLMHPLFACVLSRLVLIKVFLDFVLLLDALCILLSLCLEQFKDALPIGLLLGFSYEVFLPELIDLSIFTNALTCRDVTLLFYIAIVSILIAQNAS